MSKASSNLTNINMYSDTNAIDFNSVFIDKMKIMIIEKENTQVINRIDEGNKKNEISKELEILDDHLQHSCYFDKCLRKFRIKEDLKEHTKSHLKSKAFYCEFLDCGKIYKSKENLVLHIKNIHFRLKPYRCRFCDSCFSHRNGKTYHERKFHINYLPYKCKLGGIFYFCLRLIIECSACFASKSAMNCHINSQHLKNRKDQSEMLPTLI